MQNEFNNFLSDRSCSENDVDNFCNAMKEELMKNLHSKPEVNNTIIYSLQISITPQDPDFIKTATEWLNKGVE